MPRYAHIDFSLLSPLALRALLHPWAPPSGSCLSLVLHEYADGDLVVRAVNPDYPGRSVVLPARACRLVDLPGRPPPPAPPPARPRPWS